MFNKKYTALLLSTLLCVGGASYGVDGASYDSEEKDDDMEEVQSAQQVKSWSQFRDEFEAAYRSGNVAKLEELKSGQPNFVNINDLGKGFYEYGAGMDQWATLIEDARKNAANPSY